MPPEKVVGNLYMVELLNISQFAWLYSKSDQLVNFILGSFEHVKYLVENGAVIGAKDRDGWTALHYSSWKGYYIDIRKEKRKKN